MCLDVFSNEIKTCSNYAKETIKNANAKGRTSRYQNNEPDNKLTGKLGELKWDLITKALGVKGKWLINTSGDSDQGTDWISDLGVEVDVKTIKWDKNELIELPVVKGQADKYNPHIYLFAQWRWDLKQMILIGGITKRHFLKIARLVNKGEEYNGFKNRVNEGSYVIKTKELMWGFDELCSLLKVKRGGEL